MSLGTTGEEGLPHLEIHGVSALVKLPVEDVQHFCKLAGFHDGYTATRALFYGGYMWEVVIRDCNLNHSKCLSGKLTELHKWFEGVYIKCHDSIQQEGVPLLMHTICYLFNCSFHSFRVVSALFSRLLQNGGCPEYRT